ncbi:MAG: 5-dehydro-4-deoxy-D-glucuronate isomerase [Spirochaetales bacterium]|nr:5-dehydro-4-deoxy-D-glucuronate isomerase [Spirochaetales bacterium]
MTFDVRYANDPEDSRLYDTAELRRHYLIETVFAPGEVKFTYSHQDRIIAGGIMPAGSPVRLEAGKELGTDYFLERREMGIINVGQAGTITLDGEKHELGPRDGMYIGAGVEDVVFASADADSPARFYCNSTPAHQAYPTKRVTLKDAKQVKLGSPENLNQRTIYQVVHPAVCDSCQLVMGMTILEPGSVWNTMPCHTHERRMEVYFYFGMAEETRVFHFMGQPSETRHILLANEQAVISPSWSIHSGVGTSDYTFIWGMCGENKTFDDMDHVPMSVLS